MVSKIAVFVVLKHNCKHFQFQLQLMISELLGFSCLNVHYLKFNIWWQFNWLYCCSVKDIAIRYLNLKNH